MATIRQYTAAEATVICGAVFDETMEDQLRVTVVATGMKSWYRFSFGDGITVTDETCLGKNPDGSGERWLATLTIACGTRFSAGQ